MRRLWSSDPHFEHGNIIEYTDRPFNSVAHMRGVLVANWNAVVEPDDEVHILGDLCLGPIHESLTVLAHLNGRLVLHTGNHDRCWYGAGAKHEKWIQIYLDAGIAEIVQGTTHAVVGGHTVDVNHFPYTGDSHDTDRYTEHRPHDNGRVLLHGHCHTAWKTNGRQINVGTDVWDYTPVSDEQLVPLIEAALNS